MKLWPFNRGPNLQDGAFEDLSEMFLSPKDSTLNSAVLNSGRLDFTIESLDLVDEHLEQMRKRKLNDKALTQFVLTCGAYVGEVIRRNAKNKKHHWLEYKDAAELDSSVRNFGESLATAAILWDGGKGFSFPLGKVLKHLENGSADSVKAFAQMHCLKS